MFFFNLNLALILSLFGNAIYAEEQEDEEECLSNQWAVRLHSRSSSSANAKLVAARNGLMLQADGREVINGSGVYKMVDPTMPPQSCFSGAASAAMARGRGGITSDLAVKEATRQWLRSMRNKAVHHHFYGLSDPLWDDAWHLHPADNHSTTMSIHSAWETGATGRGVKVVHIDDGIDYRHTDLRYNFYTKISYDIVDEDKDPTPSPGASHGTAMAGIVAAVANNSACSAGVAFDANIGMVRLSGGGAGDGFKVTDIMSGQAYSVMAEEADVYVVGSGPEDNARLLDKQGPLEAAGLRRAVEVGRGGKGVVVVVPPGNGGSRGDSCAFDGMVNSIHTLAINAVGERGLKPRYTENCTAILASAFGSGRYPERYIVTTAAGGNNECSRRFSGTSSSAAVGGGVVALVLSANPNLTWRDMQHIVVEGVRPIEELATNVEWTVNGVGKLHSQSFGFGLMDAQKMVSLARSWKGVPAQRACSLRPDSAGPLFGSSVSSALTVVGACAIGQLEHVRVNFTVLARKRGAVRLELTSPMGTASKIIPKRLYDYSLAGFPKWSVLSLQFWGEDPRGQWELNVINDDEKNGEDTELRHWQLELYGTG